MINKDSISEFIHNYIVDKNAGGSRIWRRPLVGFADASDPEFLTLRKIAHPEHVLPWEVELDYNGLRAKTLISFFIPFSEETGKSNAEAGLASHEWAKAYEDTNAMIRDLYLSLIKYLQGEGYHAAVPKEAGVFDRENITSRWSHRHAARIAGLGTFGLNNMLITQAGCCGRIGSLLTDLVLKPDKKPQQENCLYKRNGSCRLCIEKCPVGALTTEGFDRVKCFAQCRENARVHRGLGNSYASKPGQAAEESGSEVCGKCLISLPCTFKCP
jgi:epoxyqueuosine reductase QueG